MSASAYTTVQARRHFTTAYPPSPSSSQTSTNQHALPPQAAPKPVQWPEGVKEYVRRAFSSENDVPEISREEMQEKLRAVINDSMLRDAVNSVDWANYPLPQQLIHLERMQSMPTHVAQLSFQDLHVVEPSSPSANKPNSKKRKSTELADDLELRNSAVQPPWRQNETSGGFENRITYPTQGLSKRAEKRQKKLQESSFLKEAREVSKSAGELEKRRQRFNPGTSLGNSVHRDDSHIDSGPVVGTCQEPFKNYFRLTAPPKAETVRPLAVLKETLKKLKAKWKSDNNYTYICDQFKSLRQDLTVQHIKNDFTVDVYELHARIALEKGDLGEYNQCQTQLRALYRQGLKGHPAEFLAYRILYFIHTCNRTDMNDVLADLTLADREEPAVRHALDVRSALALGNYHRFFRLFHETPNMGGYLMDMFIVRERLAALANICKSFKPDVRLRYLTDELGFESDEECCQFICEQGGQALFDDRGQDNIFFASGKAGQQFEQAKAAAFRMIDIKGQI